MSENKKYLTIHGHFYQPPRENPWIEEVETQESAYPNHDWNERVSMQCYGPNGASRIVDDKNSIIEISNNYKYISFNFGPTLLSWMEAHDKKAYDRIIKADKESRKLYGGHGCAIAQVYNHIIMPLANRNDKITQVIWGLKDFQKRFKRNAEGIWLAETAVDAQTLEILIDLGVKFTILSPHQAKCINKIGEYNWQDVSWGSIDPSRPYRYFVEGEKEKYIDLFFYDGSISKSVAFDNLLMDGKKFASRLNDGYVEDRNHSQLVNIATDGESYGHHTKFGEMALSYIVRVGAKDFGFEITNYAQYLEMSPPEYEVDIKPVSAWSCSHGVGRWQEDCGCSTGAQPGWNQRWRKPLRQALDYLRDELIKLCSIEGTKYYKDFWQARNNYIDVILDRSLENIDKFFKENAKKQLTNPEKVKALKLMEIQRFAQLMYTSCGWFFADISGIETTQILKYAYRAMELAGEFTKENYEKPILSILLKAKSNIREFGNGKDIFKSWVKPAAVGFEKIAAQYAIEASFDDDIVPDNLNNDDLYCFHIKRTNYKKHKKDNTSVSFAKLEITSRITLEKKELVFAMYQNEKFDYYCAVKDYKSADDYSVQKKEIISAFNDSAQKCIETIQKHFGSRLYSIKDIPIDRRKEILEDLITARIQKASMTYKQLYETLLVPITHLRDLGMTIPEGFRVCAKYTLLSDLVDELSNFETLEDKGKIKKLLEIKHLADKFSIKLNDPKAKEILSKKAVQLLEDFKNKRTLKAGEELLKFFNLLNKLEIDTKISTAQNIFYDMVCDNFEQFVEEVKIKENLSNQKFFKLIVDIGYSLNLNMEFYKEKLNSMI